MTKRRTTFGAFNQGGVPTIACFNKATIDLGVDFEAQSFRVNGIPMTDFVYPAYFETFHKPGSVTFDLLKKVGRPFQILSGGYQVVFKNGKWSQVFGSASKKRRFAREDRRGHRSEQRAAKRLRRASRQEIARAERRG